MTVSLISWSRAEECGVSHYNNCQKSKINIMYRCLDRLIFCNLSLDYRGSISLLRNM